MNNKWCHSTEAPRTQFCFIQYTFEAIAYVYFLYNTNLRSAHCNKVNSSASKRSQITPSRYLVRKTGKTTIAPQEGSIVRSSKHMYGQFYDPTSSTCANHLFDYVDRLLSLGCRWRWSKTSQASGREFIATVGDFASRFYVPAGYILYVREFSVSAGVIVIE